MRGGLISRIVEYSRWPPSILPETAAVHAVSELIADRNSPTTAATRTAATTPVHPTRTVRPQVPGLAWGSGVTRAGAPRSAAASARTFRRAGDTRRIRGTPLRVLAPRTGREASG